MQVVGDQQAALAGSKPKLPLWAPHSVKPAHWPSLPAQNQRIQQLTQQVAQLQQQNAELEQQNVELQQQSQQVVGSDVMEALEEVDELKVGMELMWVMDVGNTVQQMQPMCWVSNTIQQQGQPLNPVVAAAS